MRIQCPETGDAQLPCDCLPCHTLSETLLAIVVYKPDIHNRQRKKDGTTHTNASGCASFAAPRLRAERGAGGPLPELRARAIWAAVVHGVAAGCAETAGIHFRGEGGEGGGGSSWGNES
jgi:hypothetical protein